MNEGEPGASEQGRPADPVSALEERLGLALADRAVALAALTHRSYVNEHREDGLQDNERLEFLGDAVIDLAVSHRLMERFPAAREGDLSKMRAAVVDEQGLADMARALDLGGLLRLGRGEELTGGRAKASLLADAMEAVIAAVYHVQGLEGVLAVIDRFLGEAFARAAAGTLDRDFKTQLQELAQSRLRVTPRYRVVAEHGPDHSKVFEVEVDLRGEVLGRGRGRSKKDSEQGAAKLALDVLGRRLAPEAGGPGAETGGSTAAARDPASQAGGLAAESGGVVAQAGGASAEAGGPAAEGAAPGPVEELRASPGGAAQMAQGVVPVAPAAGPDPAKASPAVPSAAPSAAAAREAPGAAPRPRKRAAPARRPAAPKRPARRGAPSPRTRTATKRAAGGAARGAGRPARKGSRARR